MSWNVNWTDACLNDVKGVPAEVQSIVWKSKVFAHVRGDPDQPDFFSKRLPRQKNRFEYKIGEYLMIYGVDSTKELVTLLAFGQPPEIYERMGLGPKGELTPEAITRIPPEELDGPLTPEELEAVFEYKSQELQLKRDDPLPRKLDPKLFDDLGIPEKYRKMLTEVKTVGDFLECAPPVPKHLMALLTGELFPQDLEDRASGPKRRVSENQLLKFFKGETDLAAMMLALDPDQEAFLNRIQGFRPQGPWMVKGGPGSGKSLLALYAIHHLSEQAQQEELLPTEKLRVLLTTYTRALTSSSDILLKRLSAALEGQNYVVDIDNYDQVVKRTARVRGPGTYEFLDRPVPRKRLELIINRLKSANRGNFDFTEGFVSDEIEWVILGRGIKDFDTYKELNRTGRKRQIGRNQRAQIWKIWKQFQSELLREDGLRAWGQRTLDALKQSPDPVYDYVFIDEAQDLKLTELQYLVELCKQSNQIFVTADSNQSIYGGGMLWKEIAADLRFTGRTRIFRKNHRNTKEVWDAILPILAGSSDHDEETLGTEAYRPGVKPKLFPYSESLPPSRPFTSFSDPLHATVSEALALMTTEVQLSYEHAVVLAPTHTIMRKIAKALPSEMNAKSMQSSDFELEHRGVKVTTYHAAKGLQFPIVVVAGVREGVIPQAHQLDDEDELERSRRLLFVACSRATSLLALVYPKSNPSRFLCVLDLEQWEIHGERAWDHCPEDPPSKPEEWNKPAEPDLPF